ncbi:hypothetical protein D3C81_1867150 [compost metagenome]
MAGGNHEPLQVTRFTKADLEHEVHHTVDVEVAGVRAGAVALVKVPAGWSDGGRDKQFVTQSGYFALTLLGPVELHRQ